MTSNSAAWLVAEKAHPLEIKPAPYTSSADNEILVKNAAVAVNPVDWAIQQLAIMPYEYPTLFGADVAGEVVEVGKSITMAKKGDRVLGFAIGSVNQRKPESALQQYTILQQPLFSIIPNSMSFEQASVIPLCIATAAGSLYEKDHLQLQMPSLNPKLIEQTVVIWGGASSVGSNAIQLAVASGYHVLTVLRLSYVFADHVDTTVESLESSIEEVGQVSTGHGKSRNCWGWVSISITKRSV